MSRWSLGAGGGQPSRPQLGTFSERPALRARGCAEGLRPGLQDTSLGPDSSARGLLGEATGEKDGHRADSALVREDTVLGGDQCHRRDPTVALLIPQGAKG